MSELKPCPFCGSKAHTPLIQSMWFVECDNKDCGALMGFDAEKVSQEEAISAWNRRAQPANDHFVDVNKMIEQAAQDMDDKCRQWQCVLQRVHDAGTFDQNSGLWVGIDKERAAKAQASFEAYRYALGVIDKIAEHVSNPYKSVHKPGGEQDG